MQSHPLHTFRIWILVLLLATANSAAQAAQAAPSSTAPFGIHVIDESTRRGVPLVELKTVNSVSWWTDSAGWVAFDEPGLMGQEVYFHIQSPGYEYPRDFFGNHGVKLRPTSGGRAEITLRRAQVAERLYRVTGQGIYRDSALLGLPSPLQQPVLNGLVFGQDTVIATPYAGKIFWFWGDTDRASYPLGNFGASGATSELPGRGGLNPADGIDLTYFTGADGFSRPMCPNDEFGEGLKWIEGMMTLRDDDGRERLLARVAAGTGMKRTRDWHLAMFDDAKGAFASITRWDVHDTHDSAHPFRVTSGTNEYLHLYPEFRVVARLPVLKDWQAYESFTCVAGDGRLNGRQTVIDRDPAGKVRYRWKAGADRLSPGRLQELVRDGLLQPGDRWMQLAEVDTGASIPPGRGSVFWNEYRQRWVQISSGRPGEIWFSEADTPVGPWVYARRVAEHGRYNFYNPTQHPFFDEDRGRVIYFEGTYTASFSAAPAKTPRYDYNQILYRLSLDDPRLALPAPVYRLRPREAEAGQPRFQMREGIAARDAWKQIEAVAFFAIPATRARPGLIPVHAVDAGAGVRWSTNGITPGTQPLFFALPEAGTNNPATTIALGDFGSAPACRVWRSPVSSAFSDRNP